MRPKSTLRFGELAKQPPTPFEQFLIKLPSLKGVPGILPFDQAKLLRWLCGSRWLSHTEQLTARVVLHLWNPNADWVREARDLGVDYPLRAHRIDLTEVADLDVEHRSAIAAWLKKPVLGPSSK